MPLLPGLRVSAHYDLFKDDVDGKRMLVQTSRRCHVCGKPLIGAVVPVDGDRQVHIECGGKG